jgi:CheY-like chemotaxis protein
MRHTLCGYFPTTVVYIDDDPTFLRNIVAARSRKSLPYKSFSNPFQAIDHINQDKYAANFLDRIIHYVEANKFGRESLSMHFLEIIKEIFNAERYQQVSVMIVDYEMPAMKGLEVCKKIHNPRVKKILLTGVADESIAINAFNEGLIYQFIRKHDPDYLDKLAQAIDQAQKEYFSEIFTFMLKAFEHRYHATGLLDPVFSEYFEKLVHDHHIKEYYLVEPTGTFFMVDEDNQYKCLITLVDDMVETFLPDEPTPYISASDIRKVQNRELIFCHYEPFYTEPFQPDIYQSWRKHLKKPYVLQSNQTYYTYFGDNLIKLPEENFQLRQID